MQEAFWEQECFRDMGNAAHFTDHPLRGMLLQNVIAFTSIGLVCALLNLRRSWIVKASAARRQAQRRTPALSQH